MRRDGKVRDQGREIRTATGESVTSTRMKKEGVPDGFGTLCPPLGPRRARGVT
jgi:hypothetical protein